jgi:hypothetical protein
VSTGSNRKVAVKVSLEDSEIKPGPTTNFSYKRKPWPAQSEFMAVFILWLVQGLFLRLIDNFSSLIDVFLLLSLNKFWYQLPILTSSLIYGAQ